MYLRRRHPRHRHRRRPHHLDRIHRRRSCHHQVHILPYLMLVILRDHYHSYHRHQHRHRNNRYSRSRLYYY